ncbi:hypothetical protein KFE25_011251 [Diacronema lutheri]|uniref:Deacetylase sirtuin-type domain-containing protein n=1 Tax=Diacronema lutheri TaxID=2081491 RepID=A0A8J6C812_DIALT|nr:hypothetical protein KFE25_011251 [Diacronema lutheri]
MALLATVVGALRLVLPHGRRPLGAALLPHVPPRLLASRATAASAPDHSPAPAVEPSAAPAGAADARARAHDALVAFCAGRRRLLVLTGAGVSTESGIPDYRGEHGSYKRGHKPVQHGEFVGEHAHRQVYTTLTGRAKPQAARAEAEDRHEALFSAGCGRRASSRHRLRRRAAPPRAAPRARARARRRPRPVRHCGSPVPASGPGAWRACSGWPSRPAARSPPTGEGLRRSRLPC